MKLFTLLHPQSRDYLDEIFDPRIIRISCGLNNNPKADYQEANDFYPTYASLNSVLFETSVILTIWEHVNELVDSEDIIGFIHTDVRLNKNLDEIEANIKDLVKQDISVGLTMPVGYKTTITEFWVPDGTSFRMLSDPYMNNAFDAGIFVWDFIKKYDRNLFEWGMETNPTMIYSHQFACSQNIFNELGYRLTKLVRNLNLSDIGLWVPHVFERYIALTLANLSKEIKLSTALWHSSSSGHSGPGELSLYGPRPRKFYRLTSRSIPKASDQNNNAR